MSATLPNDVAAADAARRVALDRLLLEARWLVEVSVDPRHHGRRPRTERHEQMERIAVRMARSLRDLGCTCLDRRADDLGEDITPDCPVHVVPF